MNDQKSRQTNHIWPHGIPFKYVSVPSDAMKASLDPLGLLNMPLDPIGPTGKSVVPYRSSEDPSNVIVDPLGRH